MVNTVMNNSVKTTALGILVAMMLGCGGHVETHYHSDNRIDYQLVTGDLRFDSVSYKYYDNLSLWKIERWKHDLRNGVSEEYYVEGGIKNRYNWKDGKEHGLHETFDKEGRVIIIVRMNEGNMDGYITQNLYRAGYRQEQFFNHFSKVVFFNEYDSVGRKLKGGPVPLIEKKDTVSITENWKLVVQYRIDLGGRVEYKIGEFDEAKTEYLSSKTGELDNDRKLTYAHSWSERGVHTIKLDFSHTNPIDSCSIDGVSMKFFVFVK